MLDHYLALGGNEIVNSARAYGYATTAECPANWLRDPECSSLAGAEGLADFEYSQIDDAPWYDPDDPDLTARFLGLYGVTIDGLSDSTRSATITQKTTDGAITSGYRHAGREVRVRGWLTAAGMDALEYGHTWLRNALEPGACGIHGDLCGSTDTAFFVDCPPERGTVEDLTAWSEQARNLFIDPRAVTSTTTAWTTSGQAGTTLTRVDGTALGQTYAARCTQGSGSGALRYGMRAVLQAGVAYRVRFKAQASFASSAWQIQYRNTITSATDQTTLATGVTIDTTVRQFDYTFTPTVAGTAAATVGLIAATVAGADWVQITEVIIEVAANSSATFFDGATPDDSTVPPLYQYSWVGTANASQSIYEARSWFERPRTDDEYAEIVDPFRRFLHQVKCISGPFEVQSRRSRDGRHYGRLVEFTLLAEVPWVFGATRTLEVPPLVPTVVQDIAYNLTKAPSAEVAGSSVTVATNYSTNPSVETNATGWADVGDGAKIADAAVSGARSTDIAAAGSASFLATFTASSGDTNGWFGAQQSVTLPAITGARFSVGIWAIANVQSGTAVLGNITYEALWLNAGGTVLRTDTLGTATAAGGPKSGRSILPPAGSTRVVVRARVAVTSWAAGAVLRLYADALFVSVP